MRANVNSDLARAAVSALLFANRMSADELGLAVQVQGGGQDAPGGRIKPRLPLLVALWVFCMVVPVGCRLSSPDSQTRAGFRRPTVQSWFGSTPNIDGILSPGEWRDATEIRGVRDWTAEFLPVRNDADLSLRGWIKHDNESLYFAFQITDDVLYGIDTPRWLPPENAHAHQLTPDGFPWFGDEMEILLNAPNTWSGDEDVEGNGTSWQMVCNLTKSRRDGIGIGGLLEGEPRSRASAWNTYQRWIRDGAQRATARPNLGGKGYVIEWAVRFNPCVELSPGRFYLPASGVATVGLNIAVGDLDTPNKGVGQFGHFHHEQWWAGAPHTRTQKNNFGTLHLMGRQKRP